MILGAAAGMKDAFEYLLFDDGDAAAAVEQATRAKITSLVVNFILSLRLMFSLRSETSSLFFCCISRGTSNWRRPRQPPPLFLMGVELGRGR